MILFEQRSFAEHPHIGFMYRLRMEVGKGGHAHHHVPGGTFELVFDLGDPTGHGTDTLVTRPSAFLGGLLDHSFRVAFGDHADVFGVVLKQGSMRRYFNLPTGNLSRTVVPLQDLIGSQADDWRTRLLRSRSTAEMYDAVERLMATRPVPAAYRPDTALRFAEQRMRLTGGRVRIDQLAAEVNMSERNFRRRFQEVIGRNPKQHALQIRISSFLATLLDNASEQDIEELAMLHGYVDGGHLHKDAIKVLGSSLGHFAKELRGEDQMLFLDSLPHRLQSQR